MNRISWATSTGAPSRVHATPDGLDTVCKGSALYIQNRRLIRSPRKIQGRSNYCPVCFRNQKHSLEWDPRCQEESHG